MYYQTVTRKDNAKIKDSQVNTELDNKFKLEILGNLFQLRYGKTVLPTNYINFRELINGQGMKRLFIPLTI